jgi:hypothetical protein
MSADALPITPSRFAAALKDLPVSSLHLKVLELRNSIAHLDYSNEQLRPYAEGTAAVLSPSSSSSQTRQTGPAAQPDQDCIDAIRENEQVIERMQERIRLVREEVESRGLSWTEFQSQSEREAEAEAEGKNSERAGGESSSSRMVNGEVNGTAATGERHSAWSDGTFQTGVIRDGAVHMDGVAGSAQTAQSQGQGGSLSDEELRRRMEEQLRDLGGDDEDGDGGLHL